MRQCWLLLVGGGGGADGETMLAVVGGGGGGGQQTVRQCWLLLVQEASYEPVLPVLPTSLDREEVLLLTVNLSSNGEIALHNSRASKTSAENGKQKKKEREMVKITGMGGGGGLELIAH